ncbi:MAG: T9SS type A sorting domain-containing protein [Bacteroidota bacterium]
MKYVITTLLAYLMGLSISAQCNVTVSPLGAICAGATVEFTYTLENDAVDSIQYEWMVTNGAQLTINEEDSLMATIQAGSTDFTVSFSVIAEGGTLIECPETNVEVALPPSGVTASVDPSAVCFGETVTLSGSAVGGDLSGTWSDNRSGIAYGNDNASSTTASNLPTGMTTFTWQVSNACGEDEATASVMVNAAPNAQLTSNDNTGNANGDGVVCAGDSDFTLTASGGDTYQWSPNVSSGTTATVPAQSEIYTVTVTNTTTGCDDIATLEVVANPIPSATISVLEDSGNSSSDNRICLGDPVSLQAPAGLNYNWSGPGLNNASGRTQNITNLLPNNGAEVTYNLTVTDNNGCENTNTETVDGLLLPTSDIEFIPSGTTVGSTTRFRENSNANESGASLVQWLWDFGPQSNPSTVTDDAPAESSVTTSFTSTGTQTVTLVTIDDNGCQSEATETVQITEGSCAVTSVTIDPIDGGDFCPGQTLQFTAAANPSPGASSSNPISEWRWNIDGDIMTFPGSGTSLTNSFTMSYSTPGEYSVTVSFTDSNFEPCSAQTTTSFTINPEPTASLSTPAVACVGADVRIPVNTNATGAIQLFVNNDPYSVVNGFITIDASEHPTPGMYSLTLSRIVNLSTGCSSDVNQVSNYTVSDPSSLEILATSACVNGTVTLTAVESISQSPDNLGNLQWTRNGVEIPNTRGMNPIEVTATATSVSYAVSGTDENVCAGAAAISVRAEEEFEAVIMGEDNPCLNQSNALYELAAAPLGSTISWDVVGGEIVATTDREAFVNWGETDVPNAGVIVTVELTPDQAGDNCAFSTTFPVNINDSDRALDTTEIYLVSQASGTPNYFLVAVTEAQCYQWGSAGVNLDLGNARSYFPGPNVSLESIEQSGYYVQTWNGDCSTVPDCVTRSNFRPREPEFLYPTEVSISAYPNPVGEELTIELAAPLAARYFEVSIYNANGQQMLRTEVDKTSSELKTEVDVHHLPVGYYLLRITDLQTGTPWVKPLVIAR